DHARKGAATQLPEILPICATVIPSPDQRRTLGDEAMATHAIKDAPIQRRQRIGVDIPVILTTVLESMEATIADISEQGALIKGCAVPAGARVQIDYLGQTIYAQCRWGEV